MSLVKLSSVLSLGSRFGFEKNMSLVLSSETAAQSGVGSCVEAGGDDLWVRQTKTIRRKVIDVS